MSLARKYMQDICDRCENHAKNMSCEDLQTCPAWKLYCIACSKEKIVIKKDLWTVPPPPSAEMI